MSIRTQIPALSLASVAGLAALASPDPVYRREPRVLTRAEVRALGKKKARRREIKRRRKQRPYRFSVRRAKAASLI